MALIGRLRPLLVHFPIALVMVAAALRAAAAFAFLAAIAGWQMASTPDATTSLLEWHRWLGTTAAAATLGAALATLKTPHRSLASLAFRSAVFLAATLVAATGHLGGLMVWGADFWNP